MSEPSSIRKKQVISNECKGLTSALAYGKAKSRQDIEAALACCTSDFVMEAIPFGMRASGQAEVAYDLARFFEMFPDYSFVCSNGIERDGAVVLEGYARMTWTGRLPETFAWGRLFRLSPRTIEVPATAIFETRDGLLSRERFSFDMVAFCDQLGLPVGVVKALLSRLERRRNVEIRGADTIRVEQSIIVRAPIERVFEAACADVERLLAGNPPAPFPRGTRIELVGAETIRVGAIRRVHLSNGHVTDERLVACEAPRLLGYRIENGWGFPIDPFVSATYGEHELEALDGATRITWRGFVVPRSGWTTPVAQLLIATVLRPMMRRFFRSLVAQFG